MNRSTRRSPASRPSRPASASRWASESRPASASRRVLVVAGIALAAAALAGCSAGGGSSHTSSPDAARTAASASAAPTPTPTPTDPPTPVALTCDQLLTPQQVQAAEPGFAADPAYTPKDGTLAKRIADWQGRVCGWRDPKGQVIEVAVAEPPASSLEGLKNTAITVAKPVPTYGVPPTVEGYFEPGKAGQVQIFRGPYWIVSDSTAFFEPGDAAPLMQTLLANLPNG